MALPADGHLHSEWSWDARDGDMEATCRRAVELGVPAVAFTEHLDTTPCLATEIDRASYLGRFVDADGLLRQPPFDVEGYLAAVERCRDLFPDLTILSGVEFGEPHRHGGLAAQVLAPGRFDRVLGSLHTLPVGSAFAEPSYLYEQRPAADVVRDYLAEVVRLIEGSDAFAVLAHVDYAARAWPESAGHWNPARFEDEFRHALRTLAGTGRALELNTNGPRRPEIVRWWHEEGGAAVTFGSDAHEPAGVADGFADAAALVESLGFRPGRHPYDVWIR